MVNASYQAVVLAGGEDQILYPLTTTTVKALLPVANKPLISYPLRTLAEAGLQSAIVVVINERAAASVREWIAAEYAGSPGALQCEVVSVPEGYGTADALRSVASRITSPSFVVLSGDLLTDVPVGALVAQHNLHAAMATMLLAHCKVSPASETKPGKPPKNVDYIGLDPTRQHLLFYASSPDALRDLKVPLPTVRRYGTMSISSNFFDAHLYIFNRSVLQILDDNPKLSSLRQDMLPYLTQHQFRIRNQQQQQQQRALLTATHPSPSASLSLLPGAPSAGVGGPGVVVGGAGGGGGGTVSLVTAPSSEVEADGASDLRFSLVPELPGSHYLAMAHGPAAPAPPESLLRVQLVGPAEAYCARVHDVQAYGEVNREVADPGVALKLSGLKPGRFDNIVPASVTLGNKSTVAAGCILGENCGVGDKSSIKRSVLGQGCRLGTNVKVINSVLMDGVTVGDGTHIQNSVLCRGASVQAGATLKDCQVGASCVVAGGVEYKGEVLVIKGGVTGAR